MSYGHDNDSDLRINRSKLYKVGAEANYSYQNCKFDLATYITSEQSENYMAAAALTALAIGLDIDTIVDGIANYEPTNPTTIANDQSEQF